MTTGPWTPERETVRLRNAVVAAVTAPTVSLTLDGQTIPGVPVHGSLPAVGAAVLVLEQASSLLVLPEGGATKQYVDPGAWMTPTFQNSWTNFDVSRSVRFRKTHEGMVVAEGMIKGGAVGTAAWTYPVGYRPAMANGKYLPAVASGGPGYLLIQGTGTVAPAHFSPGNVTTWVTIDHTFWAG